MSSYYDVCSKVTVVIPPLPDEALPGSSTLHQHADTRVRPPIIQSNQDAHQYHCRHCDTTWPTSAFRNRQQFGAHCSNCKQKKDRQRKYVLALSRFAAASTPSSVTHADSMSEQHSAGDDVCQEMPVGAVTGMDVCREDFDNDDIIIIDDDMNNTHTCEYPQTSSAGDIWSTLVQVACEEWSNTGVRSRGRRRKGL